MQLNIEPLGVGDPKRMVRGKVVLKICNYLRASYSHQVRSGALIASITAFTRSETPTS
jgi:hypothetical protein